MVHNFDYPGHAARRMHGLPSRSGAELIDRLRQAVEEAGLPLIVQATVTGLFSDAERRIHDRHRLRAVSSAAQQRIPARMHERGKQHQRDGGRR